MTRAIIMAFHKYTPFGGEFYQPILNFQLRNLQQYYAYPNNEFDKLYLVDSNWNIAEGSMDPRDVPYLALKVNPSLRYYDAYKEVLPQIKEDLVLFMDNDTVTYKEGTIKETFDILEGIDEEGKYYTDVASIMDQIGTWSHIELQKGNKFCPYWFATRRDFLMKYLDVDWSPDMPDFETLGKLTKTIMEDGGRAWELEDDKSSIYFDGIKDGGTGKDLGYYHIRAGSTPAYLLATRKYGDKKTYWDYINKQPKNEYLRQFAWYDYMSDRDTHAYNGICELLEDCGVNYNVEWIPYMRKFEKYHNLP